MTSTLVAALAASIVGCGSHGSSPSPDLVIFERSGGIAGFDERVVIEDSGEATLEPLAGAGVSQSFRLSRRETAKLKSLLATARFDALRFNYGSRDVADEVHYRVTHGGATIDADETALPAPLRPLIRFLNQVTTAHFGGNR